MRIAKLSSSLVQAAGVLSLGAFLIACSPWTVVKQQNPNPLANQKALAAEPLHMEAVKVGKKTEAEYLAGKDEKQQASWKADLAAMDQMYNATLLKETGARGVQITPGAGPFVVRSTINMIEPGNFNGVFNLPSELLVTLQIADDKGAVLDEINFKVAVGADLYHPSVGQRLRDAAVLAGKRAAAYVLSRTGGK